MFLYIFQNLNNSQIKDYVWTEHEEQMFVHKICCEHSFCDCMDVSWNHLFFSDLINYDPIK